MPSAVRLVVTDIDGCLTPGEAGPWDWQALQAIQDINRRARENRTMPAVTLCTGRQEPYVEAIMQAIAGFVPCVYENGCGLYMPEGYQFAVHPAITPSIRSALAAARTLLSERIVGAGIGYFQPGKELSLTIYPMPGVSLRLLHTQTQAVLSSLDSSLALHTSASCLDVTPASITKADGVRWLADVTGISLADMGGIGDSVSDLAFLHIVGQTAAPANALPRVREAVGYVSPLPHAQGVLDILRHWQHDMYM